MTEWVSLGWLLAVVGILLLTASQFRAHKRLPRAGETGMLEDVPSVAVIIPARNEAANIARCLSGLLVQNYPSDKLSIVVMNDHSEDDTASIVQDIARAHTQLRLVEVGDLPDGWQGKANACWQGVRATSSEWLCFIDADTASEAGLVRSAITFAETHQIDMLSLQPFQELVTFWERLVMPVRLLVAAIAVSMPRVNDPNQPNAAANGQFILIRRDVYATIGGHEAARTDILEDVKLAWLVKQAGFRLSFINSAGLIRTRMYTDFKSVWEGQTKNAAGLFSGLSALPAILAVLLVGWLPIVIPLVTGLQAAPGDWFFVVSLGASGLLVLVFTLILTLFFKVPVYYGLLQPIAFAVFASIMLAGARRQTKGRVAWKGRFVPGKEPD